VKREEGFTFIELIVVVVIIGVLSYAAYVNFSNSHENVQVQTAARRLVSDVRYAQELAMTTGNEARVYVDASGNRYSLKWATGSYVQKPVGGGDFIVEFGEGDFPDVTITSTEFTNGRLDYLSTGAPRNFGSTFNGTKVLAVLNNTTSVVITANTGRVSIN